MKTELKVKFLHHLTQKRKDEGFTLIELLVVIIIIGILSAIALPSFLSQASKARGAEAKSNVGAVNRAQQAYYLEQQQFSTSVDALGLSFPTTTENFSYTITGGGTTGAGTAAVSATSVTNFGTSKKPDIKSYGGGVFYTASAAGAQGSTSTILCENNAPGTDSITGIGIATCGTSAKQVK